MTKIADHAVVYRPGDDGDMIQFGPFCALSLEKVREMVSDSGPIVRRNFEAWLDATKANACVEALKPLADAALKLRPQEQGNVEILKEIRDLLGEMNSTLNDVTANRREFHIRQS